VRSRRVAGSLLITLLAAAPLRAQDVPPSPADTTAKGKEMQLEEPLQPPSADDLADAIESYVEDDADLKGGYFLVYDAVDKKPLALTLVKVHREKPRSNSPGVWFACADMKSTEGIAYDVDVFVVEDEDGVLQTTDVSIHKKAGKPRYTWQEDRGGSWKKAAP